MTYKIVYQWFLEASEIQQRRAWIHLNMYTSILNLRELSCLFLSPLLVPQIILCVLLTTTTAKEIFRESAYNVEETGRRTVTGIHVKEDSKEDP
jgi:hypothetical protein